MRGRENFSLPRAPWPPLSRQPYSVTRPSPPRPPGWWPARRRVRQKDFTARNDYFFPERNLRYLNDQTVVNKGSPILPSPSSSLQQRSEEPAVDLAASYADARAARFVYYWATFTETSTSFSFTATSTIASLFCTPPGYDVVPCPLAMVGKKK